jgi:hypothetical protein
MEVTASVRPSGAKAALLTMPSWVRVASRLPSETCHSRAARLLPDNDIKVRPSVAATAKNDGTLQVGALIDAT